MLVAPVGWSMAPMGAVEGDWASVALAVTASSAPARGRERVARRGVRRSACVGMGRQTAPPRTRFPEPCGHVLHCGPEERQAAEVSAPMGTIIIREMVGTSPDSFSDAVRHAVQVASRTVRNIREVEVVKSTARVVAGQIAEYW